MRKMKPDLTWGGRLCPKDPKHGTLIGMDDGTYVCPHSDHTRESDGPIPAKGNYVFTAKEVES